MDKVFVGKIVNTHGVKGEFRVKSDFELKNEVFKVGMKVIILNNTYTITSYRVHKDLDMITVEGLTNLNDVIPFKGKSLFVDRSLLSIDNDDYLYEDMLNMDVYINDELVGAVTDYTLGMNPLLYIKNIDGKDKMVPLNDVFIKNVDKNNKKLLLSEDAKGLL